MNLEKLKQLYVPVSERLPSEAGNYLVIRNEHIDIEPLIVGRDGVYWYDYVGITHWLDLDILTTKQRAIELARDAFDAGFTKGNHKSYFDAPLDKYEFITQNQNKL